MKDQRRDGGIDGRRLGAGLPDGVTPGASVPSKDSIRFEGWYKFLANTHPATFVHEGVKYRSAAHAYYCLRAKDQDAARRYVLNAPVKVAVDCGKRMVPRDDWQEVSENVMLGILRSKFAGPFLGHLLLQTGDLVLGDGRNYVGRLLMKVRDELRADGESGARKGG
jgi:predicted NAD-dependent protein-ADP-ribosyltransferase YbiA (DUF1768 family)